MLKKIFLYLFTIAAAFAAVNDVLPTDYIATAPGSTYATLYSYNRTYDGPYAKRHKITQDTVDYSILALRLSHSMLIDHRQIAPMIILPYGFASSHGQILPNFIGEKTYGFGDMRLGTTIWLKNNNIEKEFLAVTATVGIPTGKYDRKQSLNIGEGRYRAILSAGYIKRLISSNSGELFLEISPELAYYWANKDTQARTVVQKPTYSITEYLRYRPRPTYSIFIGAQHNFGGETLVNGTPQDNEPDNQKLMIGGAIFAFDTQIMLRYGKDVSVQSGFRLQDELLLRLQKKF